MLDRTRIARLIAPRWDSTEAFAKTVEGLTLRTVQNMLTQDRDFAVKSIRALAKALGVAPETLMRRKGWT